jgi:hypothetical protein
MCEDDADKSNNWFFCKLICDFLGSNGYTSQLQLLVRHPKHDHSSLLSPGKVSITFLWYLDSTFEHRSSANLSYYKSRLWRTSLLVALSGLSLCCTNGSPSGPYRLVIKRGKGASNTTMHSERPSGHPVARSASPWMPRPPSQGALQVSNACSPGAEIAARWTTV